MEYPTGNIYLAANIFFILFIATVLISVIAYKIGIFLRNVELERQVIEMKALRTLLNENSQEKSSLADRLGHEQSEINQLSLQLKDIQNDREELNAMVSHLFSDRFRTINALCNEYFDIGASDKHKLALFYQAEKEIRQICNPDNIEQIEIMVNRCCHNIIEKIKLELPDLKQDDINLLTLTYAGFQPRAICIFMNLKLKTFYTRRSRLRIKIENSACEHKQLFLGIL